MTVTEANRIVNAFYRKSAPSDEDEFLFTEALRFLIEEKKDPHAMLGLGGFYYGKRDFELALKYYELAAEYNLTAAYAGLGYIWYYGRTGMRDYEKAFRYYSLAKEGGDLQSAYKLADMYKNGCYVEKDPEKYRAIIEELYPKVRNARYLNDPLPEVFTRLAHIRAEEGRTDEAVDLYLRAKDFLAQRIRYSDFFGDLNIMMWLTDDLYRLIPFDRKSFGLFDLYYLLTAPCTVTFRRGTKRFTVTAEQTEDGLVIGFGGKWFRSREEFFKNAVLGEAKLTAIHEELYGFEVE